MATTNVARALKSIDSALIDIKTDVAGLRTDMAEGFHAGKIRGEEMRGLIKLGFEAVAGHRQSTDAKVEAVTSEIREQTDLLKSVLVHVRRRVERVEARKPRRRS